MGVEARFRRRLRDLVREKYGSFDRLYLETGISKGHLSQIVSGKRSPTLATIVKLARLLEVDFEDLFRDAPGPSPDVPTSRAPTSRRRA